MVPSPFSYYIRNLYQLCCKGSMYFMYSLPFINGVSLFLVCHLSFNFIHAVSLLWIFIIYVEYLPITFSYGLSIFSAWKLFSWGMGLKAFFFLSFFFCSNYDKRSESNFISKQLATVSGTSDENHIFSPNWLGSCFYL